MIEFNEVKKTREDVINILFQVKALERKAECRAINTSVLDKLQEIADQLEQLDYDLTSIIGD